jgi:hypothetical protein
MYQSMYPRKVVNKVIFIFSIVTLFIGTLSVELAYAGTPGVADAQEINWLTRLAKSGDSGAQLLLGLAYKNGQHGLKPDSNTGFYWLKAAARNGNAYAADIVANHYAGNNPSQLQDAAFWWKNAARAGNANAEVRLGEFMMQQGDDKKAASWLRKAADLGDRQAHRDLVVLYKTEQLSDADLHRGDNAVAVLAHEVNSNSLKFLFAIWHVLEESSTYQQSSGPLIARAQQGDPVAEYQLAVRYRDGAWAVNPDPEKAMNWLQRSAAAGNPIAIKDLNFQHHAKDRFTVKSDAVMDGNHS